MFKVVDVISGRAVCEYYQECNAKDGRLHWVGCEQPPPGACVLQSSRVPLEAVAGFSL